MRIASRILAILAYAPAAIVAYVMKSDAANHSANPCLDCGMVIFLLTWPPALFATALFGALALRFGIENYRDQPEPRSLHSRIELSVIALPALVMACVALVVGVGFAYFFVRSM